jgi:hypothetical protein
MKSVSQKKWERGRHASRLSSGCAANKLTSSGKGAVFVEFVVQGNVVKATAIDAATGSEASIVGPANAGRDALAQAALRKLKYVMEKKP